MKNFRDGDRVMYTYMGVKGSGVICGKTAYEDVLGTTYIVRDISDNYDTIGYSCFVVSAFSLRSEETYA